MTSRTVAEINRSDIEDCSPCTPASITDVRHLSSYNWIERPTATIAVPGSPPRWSAPRTSKQLQKDSGLYYINQNEARYPESSLEPLFRALYLTHPAFDVCSIDVVTDRNNIRKLLAFINSDLDPGNLEPFTIAVEVIGTTALFLRDEAAVTRYIAPNEFRGFGHKFEEEYTVNQVNDSTGHHRIIAYRFCDLEFVVRYEADGYVATDQIEGPQDDPLLDSMRDLSLSSATGASSVNPVPSKLVITGEGRVVPPESILEIKTRAISRHLPIEDVAAQLWVSQTSKLVRAYHYRGKFEVPQVENVEAQVKRWEELNQNDLKRLASLIKTISNLAKQYGGKVTVKYDGGSKLSLYQSEKGDMLPHFLYYKWEENGNTQAKTTASKQAEGILPDTVDRGQGKTTEMTKARYGDGSYSEMISYGVDNGFRQFFRRMPMELSQYHLLCDTLDSLAIDVTEGRTIRDIMYDMRKGKDDWDPEEGTEIRGQKDIARDSAFRLLYMLMQSHVVDTNMAYNAVLFVVSHHRIFQPRTRKIVREALEENYLVLAKQQAGLNK
ncbi:geranylgeranyl pyrophosphate synthetase [Fusarium subglutinans]|uniref:Geranylgeranyl pyrophosphate synthetase n=1 Tax=Gibberella subglutinans TaxID=42677 RepID=A0A8H5L518_GIBSU|nr:geranylgeranyl pyrophosphate synthetase [Fusarium subglutinans]KAF5584869.1 geranylgeranyl pyrophosphate synthetase [Fusarium subglutinans]